VADRERLRVLHVIPTVEDASGGPPRALLAMMRAVAAARPGTSLSVAFGVTAAPSEFARAARAVATTHAFAQHGRAAFAISPSLLRWLSGNARRFDVVHIHALRHPTSDGAALICGWRGVPYILRPLGTLSPYSFAHRRAWVKRVHMEAVGRRVLEGAAGIHFTTEAEANEARPFVRPEQGKVIPHPIATTERRWTPGGDSDGDVVFVGRLDPVKGIELLLKAYAIMVGQGIYRNRLLIAGGGTTDYRRSLEALASELGIAHRTSFVGHLAPADVRSLVARCGVFCMPSATENFGLAVVEALAMGAPVVVTDRIALAAPLRAAHAAEVAERAPAPLAVALARMLGDRPHAAALSANAIAFCERHFAEATVGAALASWYETVAATGAR
jgi:glycosyltransferase involved in cell wall biosynthesis